MKSLFIFALIIFNLHFCPAQNIGIGTLTPNQSALLEIKSSNKGILIPQVNLLNLNDASTITSPATSLLVYNTNNSIGAGYYYNAGTPASPNWTKFVTTVSPLNGWSTTGNNGTNPLVNFIGTTDSKPLIFRVNNQQAGKIDSSSGNTSLGFQSLPFNTTGVYNTANGFKALYGNTTGNQNVGLGYFSLYANNTGSGNSACGYASLFNNTSGTGNTANGISSLYYNTSGGNNTAIGYAALSSNTVGYSNVAIGADALALNQLGHNLVAVGDSALLFQDVDITGVYGSTALGSKALFSNTTGSRNTATGSNSLYYNTTGNNNTANGANALFLNSTGYNNTAGGLNALYHNLTGYLNTANGAAALYNNNSGNYNVAFGDSALYGNLSAGNQTAIGSQALSHFNSSGYASNTAVGNIAMRFTTTGYDNTAVGDKVLSSNISGYGNSVIGHESMLKATTANDNTVLGNQAMYSNNASSGNTAIGSGALYNITAVSGSTAGNTALGYHAGYAFGFNGTGNVFVGTDAGINVLGGSDNTLLGNNTTYDNVATLYTNSTAIGHGATITASNQITIGDGDITEVVPGADAVCSGIFCESPFLGSSAKRWALVWTANGVYQTSDLRLKTNIQNSPYGLKEVLTLHPVVYNWKRDANGKRMSGFIAQEVEQIIPEAVITPKNSNEYYGMNYIAMIPVLTKAIQDQQVIIEQQNKKMDLMQLQIDELKRSLHL